MNGQTSQSVQVVKRDDKEMVLTQFVLSEIASGRVSLAGEWQVVALSMNSPVISALQRVINDLGSTSQLQVRVVLTARGKHSCDAGFGEIGELSIRTSQNSRLLDAHEQLVLGKQSSWTGDCMRRNPRERDAFETFGTGNSQLADWATRSFERLWSSAIPLDGPTSGASAQRGGAANLDNVLAGEISKPNTLVSASSRH